MLRRMSIIVGFLVAVVALLPAAPSRAAAPKPILGFYFPWYEESDWTLNKMADLPAPFYNGGDPATLTRHLQQARDSGLTGFICSWFGHNEARLTDRCGRLLAAAAGTDFTITVSPDQAADFTGTLKTPQGMATALRYMRDNWMSSPNWLRINGKPVVLFWNPTSFGSVAAWKALINEVDPNRNWYWIGEGVDFSYLDAFDAIYLFDITWAAEPKSALTSYNRRLVEYNRINKTNRPFVATVMPGYDDRKVRNGRYRDRANGDYYRKSWQAAIDFKAEMVIVTSWNEWFEGSQIEPSQSYGTAYLDLTREWTAKFQGATPAPPPPPPAPGGSRTFPETGQTVGGRILQYWDQNGGLPVFGLPLDAQARRPTPDGSFELQWFERNRLELHPENARPYDVLLGRLGADALAKQGRPWETLPKETAKQGCMFFAQTGHNLCEPFLGYWRTHGLDLGQVGVTAAESLALFGLPISGVADERNSSGDVVPTQWFERARFEYHKNNQPPFNVLLGRLGAELR